jgi:hypothetical protein
MHSTDKHDDMVQHHPKYMRDKIANAPLSMFCASMSQRQLAGPFSSWCSAKCLKSSNASVLYSDTLDQISGKAESRLKQPKLKYSHGRGKLNRIRHHV